MRKSKPRLHSIPGGKKSEQANRSALENLFSGKVSRQSTKKKRKKTEIPPQSLPKELAPLGNVFVAGRTVERELEFKVKFAEQKIREFCVQDFVHRFTALERRPPSIDYASDHSRFKFVVTARTTLTPEKVEYLNSLHLPIDRYTALRGVRINYDAIRQHGLEDRVKQALSSLDIPDSVIEECFTPVIELKDTFYESLDRIVSESLGAREKLEDKMLEVIQTLNPSTQIRNTEVLNLSIEECFDLVHETEIETDEDVA